MRILALIYVMCFFCFMAARTRRYEHVFGALGTCVAISMSLWTLLQ